MSEKSKHYFNRDKKLNKMNRKLKKKPAGFGHGVPENNIDKPSNGYIYVDEDTGETYIFIKKLGWIDLSSWQPDVGEGAPTKENPPEPLTGDQYIDAFTGDFYVFTEGFGWILINGVEGPPGPQGANFTFDLCTTMGSTGPVISGPIKVEPGRTVQLWIEDGNLHADLI